MISQWYTHTQIDFSFTSQRLRFNLQIEKDFSIHYTIYSAKYSKPLHEILTNSFQFNVILLVMQFFFR